MDKFETTQTMLARMPSAERVKKIEELMGMCICPDCPTYNYCARKAIEGLFCTYGGSFHCITEEKDCLCPTCPVASDLGLTRNFFCTRLSEEAQRWSAEHKIG